MDSLLIVGVWRYACVHVWKCQSTVVCFKGAWWTGNRFCFSVWQANPFFTCITIVFYYDTSALASCLPFTTHSVTRPLAVTQGNSTHSLAPSWQYRQKCNVGQIGLSNKETEGKWENEIDMSNKMQTELEREKKQKAVVERTREQEAKWRCRLTFVLSLCQTRPSLCEGVNRGNQPSIKSSMFSVCVSLSAYSPPTSSITGIVLGWGHTSCVLPKKASLLWLCVGVLLRSRGALLHVDQPQHYDRVSWSVSK